MNKPINCFICFNGLLLFFLLIYLTFNPLQLIDLWYHLSIARYIINHAAVPIVDEWTWTYSGEEWVAHSWLSSFFFYWVYHTFSLEGVFWLKTFLKWLFILLMFLSVRKRSIYLQYILLIACGILIQDHTERPYLFSNVFLALIFYIYYKKYQWFFHPKICLFMPFFFIAWVNIHPTFILGLVVLSAIYMVEGIQAIWNKNQDLFIRCIGIYLSLLLGTLVNPYTFSMYSTILKSNNYQTVYIPEWVKPAIFAPVPNVNSIIALLLVGGGLWLIYRVGTVLNYGLQLKSFSKNDLIILPILCFYYLLSISYYRFLWLSVFVFLDMANYISPKLFQNRLNAYISNILIILLCIFAFYGSWSYEKFPISPEYKNIRNLVQNSEIRGNALHPPELTCFLQYFSKHQIKTCTTIRGDLLNINTEKKVQDLMLTGYDYTDCFSFIDIVFIPTDLKIMGVLLTHYEDMFPVYHDKDYVIYLNTESPHYYYNLEQVKKYYKHLNITIGLKGTTLIDVFLSELPLAEIEKFTGYQNIETVRSKLKSLFQENQYHPENVAFLLDYFATEKNFIGYYFFTNNLILRYPIVLHHFPEIVDNRNKLLPNCEISIQSIMQESR